MSIPLNGDCAQDFIIGAKETMQLVSQEYKTEDNCYVTIEFTGEVVSNVIIQELDGKIVFNGKPSELKKFTDVIKFLEKYRTI